jgi:chemotaxis protein MotB
MAKRQKKKKQEEEGVAPWLATYGDMITLVLTLFVLLYSFSSIDAVKWDRLVSSLSGTPFVAIQALDPSRIGPDSRANEDLEDTTESENDAAEEEEHEVEARPTDGNSSDADTVKEQFDELYMKISEHIKNNQLETKLNVEKLDDFIILHITDSTLFSSGKAYIKPESKEMLHKVADLFAEYNSIIKIIRIEGHTDNRPIHNDEFKSNWELSTTRAVNVLRYFLGITDIENNKFCASGYGEYHPIATNDTKEGRSINRRVDFLIESIYTHD